MNIYEHLYTCVCIYIYIATLLIGQLFAKGVYVQFDYAELLVTVRIPAQMTQYQ